MLKFIFRIQIGTLRSIVQTNNDTRLYDHVIIFEINRINFFLTVSRNKVQRIVCLNITIECSARARLPRMSPRRMH